MLPNTSAFALNMTTPMLLRSFQWKCNQLCLRVCNDTHLTFHLRGTPVCCEAPGPDCDARTHCYLPMRGQGKPAACCVLAERGEQGQCSPQLLHIHVRFMCLCMGVYATICNSAPTDKAEIYLTRVKRINWQWSYFDYFGGWTQSILLN